MIRIGRHSSYWKMATRWDRRIPYTTSFGARDAELSLIGKGGYTFLPRIAPIPDPTGVNTWRSSRDRRDHPCVGARLCRSTRASKTCKRFAVHFAITKGGFGLRMAYRQEVTTRKIVSLRLFASTKMTSDSPPRIVPIRLFASAAAEDTATGISGCSFRPAMAPIPTPTAVLIRSTFLLISIPGSGTKSDGQQSGGYLHPNGAAFMARGGDRTPPPADCQPWTDEQMQFALRDLRQSKAPGQYRHSPASHEFRDIRGGCRNALSGPVSSRAQQPRRSASSSPDRGGAGHDRAASLRG